MKKNYSSSHEGDLNPMYLGHGKEKSKQAKPKEKLGRNKRQRKTKVHRFSLAAELSELAKLIRLNEIVLFLLLLSRFSYFWLLVSTVHYLIHHNI